MLTKLGLLTTMESEERLACWISQSMRILVLKSLLATSVLKLVVLLRFTLLPVVIRTVFHVGEDLTQVV